MGARFASPGKISVRAGPNNSSATTAIPTRPSERIMSVNVFTGRAGTAVAVPAAASLAGASPDKGGHLVEHSDALIQRVVEVRPDPDPAAGAVVDDELPRDQLVVHSRGVSDVDRHVAAAFRGVAR